MPTVTLKVKNDITKFDKQAKSGFFDMYKVKKKTILDKFGALFRTYPSDGPSEKYPHAGATPQLQDYEEGNVPVSELSAETQTIENKTSGMAVAVGLEFFEDIDRMPGAKQMYLEKIQGLSIRAANWKVKLMADAILRTGRFAAAVCWDGEALFSTSHTNASNIIDTGTSNSYTTAQLKAEHNALLDASTAMKDPQGEDYLREEAPNKWLFLVDPQVLTDYAQFYRAMQIPSFDAVAAAVANILAPGNKEMAKGIDGLGNDVYLVGWSRLRDQSMTIALDISGELPGPPPIIDQERIAPALTTLGFGSDMTEVAEQLWWKVRMRGGMGYGDFCKIFKIDKS